MKRFYNNTLMSGAFSKALRVIALLCVLLGVSSTAMADAGFWTDDAWDFYWYSGSKDEWKGGSSDQWKWSGGYKTGATVDLGTISGTPYLKGFKARVWKNGGSDIQGVKVTYSGAISGSKDLSWKANYDADGSTNQYWEDTSLNIALPTTVGSHTINLTLSTSGTSKSFTATITYTISGGGGTPSGNLPTSKGDCQKIVIQSKNNYGLYVFSNGNAIAGMTWDSSINNKGTLTNGYYTWTIDGYDNVQVIFRNSEGKQSGDSPVLYGGYSYVFDGEYISGDTRPVPNPTSYAAVDCSGSGSGGDDDDDPVDDCNSEEIQIWCKGKESYIDMWCYAWEDGNDSNKPLGNWCGSQKQTTGTYNDATYAVWTVSGIDVLNVIFNNCGDAQTSDLLGLEKGYRYIFDLAKKADGTSLDNWQNQVVYSQRIACGGGDVEEVHNGSLYLDLTKFADWSKDDAVLKAKMIKGDGTSDIINLVQCTTEPNIYYFESIVNLANYKKVQMLRTNPADGATWNSSAEHTFSNTLVCVNITNWDNSSNISNYTGSCSVVDSNVLIAKQAVVSPEGTAVSLYGYLSGTSCNNAITEYGFVYCQGSATQGCIPSRNSPRIRVQGGVTHLVRGDEFSVENYDGLVPGYTYGYKAYVMVGDMMMLSDETGYFTLADCTTRPVKGSPLTYTIDASLGVTYENACNLTYGSLETAIKRLKESYNDEDPQYQYVTKNGDSYNLNQDVTMNVRFYDDSPDVTGSAYAYAGTTKVTSAGSDKVDGGTNLALLIDFINLNATDEYTLTIKADNPNAQPWVHHPIIRNSRNITLDGLAMYSDPSGKINDCAFEIDVNTTKWDGIQLGQVADANILIKNCYIGSSGFSGVHVSGYDGVTFVNNEFEATFDKGTSNDKEWGASAKFMTTKNVKFINNNFRGDHCTLLWIQECQNMLFMNNVFWNTNKFMDINYTPSAIRLVTQFGTDLQNIGVFYNTSYFAANTTTSESKYDFMSFKVGSGATSGGNSDFKVDAIYFKYNNCYSYDLDCPGRSDSPFLGISLPDENFCGNNFWSQYDQDIFDDLSDAEKNTYVSKFAFGCSSSEFINVKGEVCATTATGPASLVVQGENLNLGTPLTVEDIETATGIEVTDEEVTSDRYNEAIRKEDDRWTLGAYQQKDNIDTKVIIWQGVTSNQWDDRNNWIDAATGQRLSCLHNLAEDLIAIIPSANSDVYPTPSHGVLYWPNIPSSFEADDRSDATKTAVLADGIPAREQVTANANEFAKTIQLEYGAGITGIENLVNGKKHYTNAIMGFTAPRQQWILVGTVIMPNDEENPGNYRNIKSGDYFIKDQMPHVYMHEATLDADGNASWGETFADLNVSVEPTTVFAINLANEYGKYKLPADYYNMFNPGANVDANKPHTYENFNGKFVNDDAMPNYTGLTEGKPTLLNNSYPANVDARKIESLTGGKVQYYNYSAGTFMNTDATTDAVLLRPQHGFIFTPAAGKNSLEITTAMLAGGDTKSRSAEVTLPTLSLNLYNANTGVGYSNVVVKVDNMLAEGEVAPSNVVKVFSPNVESPELYIVANDEMYSRYSVANESQMIPLGVKLKKDMNIKFERAYFQNFSEATLIDTYTDKEINLLRNTYTTETLVAGEIEGRFFLNLGVAVEEEEDNNGDDNVSTELEENEELANGAINIFVDDADNTIKVVTNDVELQVIYVSDMAGRTMKYDVKGYAANLKLPVAQGVYTVSVIGDTASRTEKVILK